MMAAGTAYAKSKEAPAKEIMKDLIEMAKGIQNPIRGLFLRYYMLKKLKEVFPDVSGQFEGYFVNNYARTVEDTVDFLIKNLYEMNRLWIKLYNSTSKTRSQRETERNELNMLVGENIVRLSSIP